MEEDMAEASMQELDNYVNRCQNTSAQFIATRPIMDMCLATARRLGARVLKQWREQEGLNLAGIWEAERVV